MKNEQPPSDSAILKVLLAFFEKAIDVLKPPVMKFFVVLSVALLLAFALARDKVDSELGFVLIIVVIVLFALIAGALEYAEKKFQYAKRTEEELKRALRDTVIELQTEKKRAHRLYSNKKNASKKEKVLKRKSGQKKRRRTER
jgi:ABC-type transport system involved in cytochrome bd biosynthesis fused ATPase/permease subunit